MSSIVASYKNSFTAIKIPCALPVYPYSLTSQSLATIDIFSVSIVLPFLERHVFEITQ